MTWKLPSPRISTSAPTLSTAKFGMPTGEVRNHTPTVFCFAVVLERETPLVPFRSTQLSQCDEHRLVSSSSNEKMRMVGLFSSHATNGKYKNTPQLITAWDFVLRLSRFGTAAAAFDWYVKVDADTLLRPTVLRIILRRHLPSEALAIGNVPKGLAHPALLWPLQVISRKAAARMVSAGLARWKSFYHPQEDVWLFNLLTALNVTLKVDLHPWMFPTWDKPSLPLSHCSCKIRQKETPQPCRQGSPLEMVYTFQRQKVSASSGGYQWDNLTAFAVKGHLHAENINAFLIPFHPRHWDHCVSVDAPAYHALKTPQDFQTLLMALALWSSFSQLELNATLTTRHRY